MISESLDLKITQHSLQNISIQNPSKTASWLFEYLEEHQMAIYTIKGYFTAEDIKHIYKFLSYHVYSNQMPVVRSVTDSREVEGSFHQMNDWFIGHFMPKVVANGFKANANILSEDFYAKLAQEDLDAKIGDLFEQRQFEDFQEGYNWVITR